MLLIPIYIYQINMICKHFVDNIFEMDVLKKKKAGQDLKSKWPPPTFHQTVEGLNVYKCS